VPHGPSVAIAWAVRPDGLQLRADCDDNLVMTSLSTQITRQATTSRPSARLAALHRKAGESAILRDGRLEIAIDESGALSARVVGAYQ
jgi:hypothetical protein